MSHSDCGNGTWVATRARVVMRALFTWVAMVLLGVQTSAAQEPVRTADIAGRPLPADNLTCGCGEPLRLVWSCGDVVLVRLEGPTSVRFGRTAGPARPRVLALVRSSTGRYFVVAGDGLFEFIVKQMLDGANCFSPVMGRTDLLHFASVRDLPLTSMP